MFISRQSYDDLREEVIQARSIAKVTEAANTQLRAHMDWLQIRLTELSMERAQLLKRYMNIDVAVPTFDHTPAEQVNPNQTSSFEDMGDDLAREQGISWDDQGRVVYSHK